ncbi:MAG: Curculin domain protein (Mannose-binding) lectin [Candidatus Uhrbacteria bacterium GW2011_GWD2_52_7]|uniref:Curculin domain protein (Mannose-binding) lectin n=1 Tax=Candidatus Uhrbacteria bacterium GW2011_GWD2_52_7 TaxID=1618989 RepID=A0A0G1ZNG1_9BACT|nr:MAG: Curculin domain protein (Mannose-binding) lectin [Candidatus Uhrbacteria bacterium GW2011_GWD2_52_7]
MLYFPRMKRLTVFAAILGLLLPLAPAFAFDPDFIIADSELTNEDAMNLDEIQAFLNKGYLADYETEDWQGVTRSAAEIIWRAAQDHNINPRFILVLLQKEQSLIEDDEPTQKQLDWAAGYAVCDDCSLSDASISRWKGFGKQVNSASMQFAEGYLADIEDSGITQGIPVVIDGTVVTPENAATAAMYAYTPHIHGNKLFVSIWERWFGHEYPTGSLLQVAGEAGVWRIEYGYRRPITSWSALVSRFNPNLIIPVTQTALEQYPIGNAIALPNYSILRDEDSNLYLLVNDTLRPIESMEVFRKIGFSEDEIVDVDNDEIDAYDIGTTITATTQDPNVNVLKLSTNGATFAVQDGVRHSILDATILKAMYPGVTPTVVEPVVIEQYREGTFIKLPDGYLVRSYEEPAVFVISEGVKRPILSEHVFLDYGYSWDDIVFVSQDVLDLHATGDVLTSSEE